MHVQGLMPQLGCSDRMGCTFWKCTWGCMPCTERDVDCEEAVGACIWVLGGVSSAMHAL